MATKQIYGNNWPQYWKQYNSLFELNFAYDHLDRIFNEIEALTGQVLLSADMVGIQEALIDRIEDLSCPKVNYKALYQFASA
jgi:hypothetical protein